jgi:hypothetical protein
MPTVDFARHALDQNALGFQRQAEIVGEIGDAAVLDSGFRLEFERRDHRAGIDLRDLPVNSNSAYFSSAPGQQLEFIGINGLLLVGRCSRLLGGSL